MARGRRGDWGAGGACGGGPRLGRRSWRSIGRGEGGWCLVGVPLAAVVVVVQWGTDPVVGSRSLVWLLQECVGGL